MVWTGRNKGNGRIKKVRLGRLHKVTRTSARIFLSAVACGICCENARSDFADPLSSGNVAPARDLSRDIFRDNIRERKSELHENNLGKDQKGFHKRGIYDQGDF